MKMSLNGKLMKEGKIVGYELQKEDGSLVRVQSNKILDLAKKGVIEGVEVDSTGTLEQGYIIDNEVYSKLGVSNDRYEVVDRVIEDNRTIGYVVKHIGSEKTSKISIDKAWELAFDRLLKGAKAKFAVDTKQKILLFDER